MTRKIDSVQKIVLWFVAFFLSGPGFLSINCVRAHSHFVHTDRTSQVPFARPDGNEAFCFGIFGDQTGTHDPVATLKVLQQAVGEMNLIGPDLVMNVGDMIDGYNQTAEWIQEMKDFMGVMNTLDMPWFPVAGNHDVYWRGEGRPPNEHEGNYERYFGPLWYAFKHKECWFFALYSDEGHPETGEKNFSKAACQTMSERQTKWLTETLKKAKAAQHVFLFLHHPRWNGGKYGDDWNRIHAILRKAGNVSAVFAGHTHTMKYNGERDGIEYFTLGTTGGALNEHNPPRGKQHHYDLVTVRGDDVYVTAFPVGSAIDPRVNRVDIQILTPWERWMIDNETQRLLSWSIKVPAFQGVRGELRVGVSHALDDSGDLGIHYALMNGQNRTVSSGFLGGRGTEWVKYPVEPGQRYFFTLSDHDTALTGETPGNGGKIQIELDVILREYRDPTRKK